MVPTLVTLLLCATALWLSRESWRVVERRWMADRQARERVSLRESATSTDAQRIESRRIAVLEREVALKERQFADRPVSEPMPVDLERRCESWDEPFMQEQEKSTLLAMYAEYRSWEEVRRRLVPLQVFGQANDESIALGESYAS